MIVLFLINLLNLTNEIVFQSLLRVTYRITSSSRIIYCNNNNRYNYACNIFNKFENLNLRIKNQQTLFIDVFAILLECSFTNFTCYYIKSRCTFYLHVRLLII